eukprot:Skav208277  [mRNA]  locus=scaffold1802:101000:110586:+ [translate_table: standard]
MSLVFPEVCSVWSERKLSGSGKQKQALDGSLKSRQERLFEVTLVKTDGQKLGLDVDYMAERKVLPILHVTGGVAEEWNRKNPSKKMHSGDCILEVNGITGNVAEILEKCKADSGSTSLHFEHSIPKKAVLSMSIMGSIFHPKGFDDKEIVALCGAHTVGSCHLERSGYDGPWTEKSNSFDNSYFKDLLNKQWQEETNSKGKKQFRLEFAEDQNLWFSEFGKAWIRLQEGGCQELRDIL